jgi:hypothetical protein
VLLGYPPDRTFRYFGEPMRSIMREGRLELRTEVDRGIRISYQWRRVGGSIWTHGPRTYLAVAVDPGSQTALSARFWRPMNRVFTSCSWT